MKYIGAHFSISNGFDGAIKHANEYGANALAMFTKPSTQWKGSIITEEASSLFKNECGLTKISAINILPHASYLINMGNPDVSKRENAKKAFIEELKRCRTLGLTCLNFHPGSGLGTISESDTVRFIGKCVKEAIEEVPEVMPIFESTAGTGKNVGYSFEQLRDLIAESEYTDKVGICIDTCHTFCAGYDFRTQELYDKMMNDFDKIVGIRFLKGMHLNDSMNDIGTRKDRHASLGKGFIGLHPFKYIIKDKRTDNIPLVLETPDGKLWKDEITTLRSFE